MTTPDPGSATPPPTPWEARTAVPAPGTPADRQWAAFIGPRWPTYRRKFLPFFDEARFTPTWNWAAALFTPIWFLYRKLYLPFIVFFFLPTFVFQALWREEVPQTVLRPGDPLPPWFLMQFGVQLSAMILAGGTANYLLFRRGRAAQRVLADRNAPADQALPFLARVGGTNRGAVAFMLALIGVGVVMMMRQAGGTAP